jgi:hypothetical protein
MYIQIYTNITSSFQKGELTNSGNKDPAFMYIYKCFYVCINV